MKTLLKYKKSIAVAAIIIGVISFFVISRYSTQPITQAYPEEKVVEVEFVKKGSIKQTADFIGTIKAGQQTALTAKTKGVLSISAKSGQLLKKGDLIAEIDNKQIEHNYEILKEAETIAKSQVEREKALLQLGIVSASAVELKQSTLLDSQKRLSDARKELEELKIYAPFDGTIGLFKFREGSQVNNGDIIVYFYHPGSLIVEFEVTLSVAKQVEDGDPVFINGKEYRLTYIQKMLDEATHMSPAYVEIDCANCVIGTAVDVSLVTKEKHDVIVIPFEAVFLRKGKPFVYIGKENKAKLTPVELGIREKKFVEITSGLEAGDPLIVYGHNRLYPDSPVKISSTDLIPSANDQ